MLLDTRSMSFDMREIDNRRFMFSPQAGELILGRQYRGGQLYKSHAEEHFDSGAKAPFDSFIRGWIGTGRDYPDGVIHFAPNIGTDNIPAFDNAFSTLQMFSENGAAGDTVVRGFGRKWEQPLKDIITPTKERSKTVSEQEKNYSSYDFDRLEVAKKLVIERSIYFESEKADISALTGLSLAELTRLRQESAAAEQAVFDRLKTEAAAWEQQAGNTRFLEKAIEYVQTPPVKHTSNKWEKTDYEWQLRSNAVYQMRYHVYENTRYDRQAQKSVPYSWSLTWSVYTNGPNHGQNVKIAGQERKTFSDKAAMEKYLAGRIKAYDRLFTETMPPVPKEYAEPFKVNGLLLPGYAIEGEPPQHTAPQQAAQPTRPDPEKVEMDAAQMMKELVFMIAVPALTAMCLNKISHDRVKETWPSKLALISKIALIFVVTSNSSKVAPYVRDMNMQRFWTAVAILVLAASGYAVGWLAARIMKKDREMTVSMIYGAGMRNISAGAVIAAAYFPGEVMFPVIIGTLFQQVLAACYGKIIEKRLGA